MREGSGAVRANTTRILIVEDDDGIRDTLKYHLSGSGYVVGEARDGAIGLRLVRTLAPDLILLDLMLPGMSGIEFCRVVRRTSQVPIIMLTAKDSEVDKIVGLELGADDYITKPFSLREMLARIHAVIRRAEADGGGRRVAERETIGRFVIDRAARRVVLDGEEVRLASREFELLSFLVAHSGRVHSRDVLLHQVWGPDFLGDRKTVDVHVRWLRQKFGERAPFEIVTVRGSGYRLDRPQAEPAEAAS